ncbi:MAG: hypothetical protein Ta2B_13960 [Termitinemataceae bacterium]|nr:MAG: hypothetical protein Ta2B_13960 [Termitinemataceae bacterium]
MDWATEHFRTVLKDLQVQNISPTPKFVLLSDYREHIIAGMDRCVIIIKQAAFSDKITKGNFILVNDKERKLFYLIISIDTSLFSNTDIDDRIKQKAIAVHEFTHCAAALFLLSVIRTESFIDKLTAKIAEKVKKTTAQEFENLLSALVKINIQGHQSELLTDDHFRIGDEGFSDNYAELYLNFLLSYQLVEETLRAAKIRTNKSSLPELLQVVVDDLHEKKALEHSFILNRLVSYIPRLIVDFPDKHK